MTDSELIKSFVDEYQLEVDGVKFWTPYWIDELPSVKNPKPKTGPFKGKGTPDQIKDTLLKELGKEHSLSSSEDFRSFMRGINLGVECSGFIYYVLDNLLKKKLHAKLSDYLYKPRSALLSDFHNPVYTHPPYITEELLNSQPEQVKLSKIQEFWGNDPVRLAGINILTSSAANQTFNDVTQLRPADLIRMLGHDKVPHAVIVVSNVGGVITYAHSGGSHGRNDYYGGVEIGTIEIVNESKPIQDQRWHSKFNFVQDTHYFEDLALRRLKVLDEPKS